MSHSILPPSSAAIWGKPGGCTGWVLMNQSYPENEESVEAREGTASHEIASKLLDSAKRGFYDFEARLWVGRTADNGVVFTEEMFEAAVEYVNDVVAVMKSLAPHKDNVWIEERVECPDVHDMSWGTVDAALFSSSAPALYVWDYKYGFEVVEAFENWQSINYANGLVEKLLQSRNLRDDLPVHIRIAQPRAFHRDGPIREWSTTLGTIRYEYGAILHENARAALGPDATFHTGSHCKHCAGRARCPAALKAGMGMYEATSAPMPVEMPPESLGTQLNIVTRARKQLEYLESGLQEQVAGLLRSGKRVPGWSAEQGVGREKWGKPVEEVIALGDMLNVDLRKPRDAITPNAARKLGIDASVITAYSTKPSTGVKIVPDNGNKAKQVFSK